MGLARLARAPHRALGDRILVMFPFEAPLYEKAGVPVTYVGHPLADLIPLEPEQARGARRAAPAGRQADRGAAPGSRRSELQYMAKSFVLAAHRFRQEVPTCISSAPR